MDNPSNSMVTGRARIVLGVVAAIVLTLFALQSSALMGWLGFRGFGTDHIRLGAYEGDVGALEWIAQDQGFFDKVGLSVEIKGFSSGKEATDALKAGAVDVATAAEFVAASRSFSEPELRVLGSISYYRNKGLVGRRDRGIDAPSALKGKRIGVTSPSGSEYALYVFLALHGLSVKDVTTFNLAPKQLVEAIAAGTVDAAITWEPHVQEIQAKLGADAITFQGDGFDTYLLLLTQQAVIANKSAAMRKLLHALVLAEDWLQAHPDDARRYVASRFKLDLAYVEALWPSVLFEVALPQELLAAMDGEARWLAKRDAKDGAAIPNYARFMHPDELNAVRPSAVTLLSETRPSPSTAASGR